MPPNFRDLVIGDPIDAALVRAATRKKLFGIDEPVTVGRLVVQERLGAGAIGVVYQARDPELGRTVAVKLLQTTDDEQRLLDEARALARLRHPNVVAVHDVGTWEGRVFLTMEHVTGGTLRTWLAAEPRGWRAIVPVLVHAARGLAAAHRSGLVHRDVKPDNVLVTEDGEARIADFGLARPTRDPTRDPGDGAEPPAGTPAYLAPEVLAGKPADAASDQYGFAVMARDALADDRSVPAHVRAAITRGLTGDPAARFPSMDALVTALEHDVAAARRQRMMMAAVAVVVLLGGTGVWFATRDRASGPSCSAAGRGLDDVWTAARRADVSRALTAKPAPYAASMATSVIGALDAYAVAWSRAEKDVCEDAHVRRTLSPALVDLRTRCLARGRAALTTTVSLLAAGGDDVTSGALAMVEGLPDLAACDDLDALAAPGAPEAAAAARLTELEAELATAEALSNAARLDEALAKVREVVAAARTLGHRPFLAQALFTQGTIERTRGDKPAAATSWREALAEAQASRHDELVAQAAIKLASVHADGELDRAEDLLQLAAATIERLGNAPRLRVAYAAAFGKLLYKDGRYDDAALHLQQAVEHDGAAGHGDTAAHAQLLTNLGGALMAAGKDADALAPLERAIAIREARLGAGHPDVAETLNTLGIVLGHLGRETDALAQLDRAVAIVEANGAPLELWSMLLDNKAGVLGRTGKVDDALAAMRASAAIAEKTLPAGDVRLAGVYTNLATIMQDVPSAHAEAITLLDRALAIHEANGQGGHPEAAIAVLTRGVIRIHLGQTAEAIADCQRAATIASATVGAEHPIALEAGLCQERARSTPKKP